MAPHPTKTLLRDATNCWMSNAHLTQYQALHLDKDRLTFDKCMTINPTTLFLDNYPKEHIHNWRCLKMLDVIQET